MPDPSQPLLFNAESIVDTVREPLLVLSADLRVRKANPSFYRTFKVTPEETVGQLNQLLRGWANYFCLGTVTAVYSKVTDHARYRLRWWLTRKFKLQGAQWSRYSAHYLHDTLGLLRLQRPSARPSRAPT